MCGIIGYIGTKDSSTIVKDCLKKIEYRGYDSSGISVIDEKLKFITVKNIGSVEKSIPKDEHMPPSNIGIGHTRWATHGKPSRLNAHPHNSHNFSMVHNGIIENYQDIKKMLRLEGYNKFASQTDSEALLWLIERNYQKYKEPRKAISESLKLVKGTFGLAILFKNDLDHLFVARRSSPIIIGGNVSGFYASSDIQALPKNITKAYFLEDDQIAVLSNEAPVFYNLYDKKQPKNAEEISLNSRSNHKGGYEHYMLKEIYEQPHSVKQTLRGRLDLINNTAILGGLEIDQNLLKQLNNLLAIGCGTASNSSHLCSYLFEDIVDVPLKVEIASEFLYRKQIIDPTSTLAISISQSGETADTIAATNKLNLMGVHTHGIVNTVGSNLSRITNSGNYLYCGPEVAVASTKAFTSQVVAQILLGLKLNSLRGEPIKNNRRVIKSLKQLSKNIQTTLDKTHQSTKFVAEYAVQFDKIMFIARNSLYPIAQEGALKFKEVTYTPASAYPAGEMKHGPLALVDKNTLVICLAMQGHQLDKTINNIREIEAREGRVVIVSDSEELTSQYKYSIKIPSIDPILAPLLFNIPLQLLAYYAAKSKGLSIDKPRNLAKSVTVE